VLVHAPLTILFLSDTYAGRVHEKRIAEATPYPLPAGSRLLQDLGFVAFTLPQVAMLMPTKKPRGQELTLEQRVANQALLQRRLRIEHVHSSVKRCRIVKDRIRLWKQGVRDLVMELCCALHNFGGAPHALATPGLIGINSIGNGYWETRDDPWFRTPCPLCRTAKPWPGSPACAVLSST
jgi:DDE superfamily endonuclease